MNLGMIKIFFLLTFYCQVVLLKNYHEKDSEKEISHKPHNSHSEYYNNKKHGQQHPVRHHNGHQHHHFKNFLTTTTTTSTTKSPPTLSPVTHYYSHHFNRFHSNNKKTDLFYDYEPKNYEDENDDDEDYYYDDSAYQYDEPSTTISPNLLKIKTAYESLIDPYRKKHHSHSLQYNDHQHQQYYHKINHQRYENKYPTVQTKSLKFNKKKYNRNYNDDEDYYYDDEKEQNDDNRSSKNYGNSQNYDNNNGYIPGTLTQHKFETLGDRANVEQSRNLHLQQTDPTHFSKMEARKHMTKLITEGRCNLPKPKIIQISGDSNKEYYPHCTILHRCSDDTGCCDSHAKTCVKKKSEIVDLYFIVKTLKKAGEIIEIHKLENHTECHCVNGTSLSQSITNVAFLNDVPREHNRHHSAHCPRLFEKVFSNDNNWRCDCSSGNIECNNFKNGGEHFSIDDRKCISSGRCKQPTCEFGPYITEIGRCPVIHEKAHNYQNTYNRYLR